MGERVFVRFHYNMVILSLSLSLVHYKTLFVPYHNQTACNNNYTYLLIISNELGLWEAHNSVSDTRTHSQSAQQVFGWILSNDIRKAFRWARHTHTTFVSSQK